MDQPKPTVGRIVLYRGGNGAAVVDMPAIVVAVLACDCCPSGSRLDLYVIPGAPGCDAHAGIQRGVHGPQDHWACWRWPPRS